MASERESPIRRRSSSLRFLPNISNLRRDHMLSNGFSFGALDFFASEFRTLSFFFILFLLFFFFALSVLEFFVIFVNCFFPSNCFRIRGKLTLKQNRASLVNCRLKKVLGERMLIRVYDNLGKTTVLGLNYGLFQWV